ncbi:MAG: TPM domain-containing protein [Lachnospiraceae bacterium]|nr:TPM domain-containing protein [Lachnospiraceae bacterium]
MKRDENKRKIQLRMMLLAVLLLAASLLVSIFATTKIYAAASLVSDDADVLEDYEISDLSDQAEEATAETGWNVILATTDDAGGRTTMEYADDLYDQTYGINTDGIAIVIDLDNRNYYISTSGSALNTINGDKVERVLDAGYDDVLNGYYADALSAMLKKAVKYKENEKPHLSSGDFVLAGLLAAGVFFAVVGITAGRYRLKWGTYSYDYHKEGKVKVTQKEDKFVNEVVTHHRIQTESSGGGGGTHMSSGGGIHGGGGRSF